MQIDKRVPDRHSKEKLELTWEEYLKEEERRSKVAHNPNCKRFARMQIKKHRGLLGAEFRRRALAKAKIADMALDGKVADIMRLLYESSASSK